MGEEGRNFEQEIAERAAKEKNLCCLCCLLFEQNLVLISKIATIERLRAVCPVSRLTYEACMGYFSEVREHWTFIYSPSDTPVTASDGVIF